MLLDAERVVRIIAVGVVLSLLNFAKIDVIYLFRMTYVQFD